MSSDNPSTKGADLGGLRPVLQHLRSRRHALTLRTRLLLALGALLATGILVCSGAGVTALRAYLLDQVDEKLLAARTEMFEQLGNRTNPFSGSIDPSTLTEFTLEARSAEGVLQERGTSHIGDDGRHVPDLDPQLVLNHKNGAPFTVPSEEERDYDYRVAILQPSLDSDILVMATPLASVHNTVGRLIVINIFTTIAVLLVLVSFGYVIIRRDLAPLEEMTSTAGAIGAGDLTRRVNHPDTETEVGRLGTALNAMLSQIEASFAERKASEDRLRRFAADASHELRTPLTAIRGYAELHRQGAVTDEAHLNRVMQRIETEATRMGMMVEDLLLLARLDQGRPLETTAIDMASVIQDVVSDANAIAPDRTVTLSLGHIPLIVEGDEGRLHQVLTNLVSNAFTHTPSSTPVHISADCQNGFIEVCVKDEGPGMDVDAASKVFERFYRVDAGRARSEGGTGLGLAIVDALVRAHRGSVSVVTSPGHGAAFTVRLPEAKRS